MTLASPIIKISELDKIYSQGNHDVHALKKISLEVYGNEFVAIMGQSGSGKSTMMNILGCLDRPTGGHYLLDSQDVSRMKDDELAAIRNLKIGFVFQSFNLLTKLSALENVELPMIYSAKPRVLRRKAAMEALERVGLADRVRHRPNELSGGQRQRVAIARALVNTPSIILADEPTGNLDSQSSAEIMQIFQKLHSEGATIIVVTHEPEIAAHTKRVVTFRDGIVVSDIVPEPRKEEQP
ncbi:MAG: ABC transporter ATP-binding protein [Defluviitaleaceae bacterium]|nr:ABC transporter ATP-binding protein [Defluviitaleaceae bacterium]